MFKLRYRELGFFDVLVCGGGTAGVCAAIRAAENGANTLLVEEAGCLGGTMTNAFMPNILDSENKGGSVKDLFDFLNEHGMTCQRRGNKVDENGKKIPGCLIDAEGAKYFFDKRCKEAGVKVLFHSRVMGAEVENKNIKGVLISTDCGNFTAQAKIYIDASGNGSFADECGCKWECGEPGSGRISPLSMSVCIGGYPKEYNGTDSAEAKTAYANMLKENDIEISAGQAGIAKLPNLQTWSVGVNFQYGVNPDDIDALSKATSDGRAEVFEVFEKHKEIPGYESIFTAFTGAHIGIREGRRIFGEYRITNEDIIEGRKFEDGICHVTAAVDVHKLEENDTLDCQRGVHSKPYHIPYRTLVAKDCNNLLLAGRCISGDFYPHASYRMMGNMMTVGDAAGFAAAKCAKENILPKDVDGKEVKKYQESLGQVF